MTLDKDASKEEQTRRNTLVGPRPLDLNTEVCGARRVENLTKEPLSGKQCGDFVNTRGIDVDLNAEDVTSSINVEPASVHKGHGHFKSKDVSESGSCIGPIEEKDPMRIWREMKQNGFLSSSSHGGIPVPKQRGRKSKNEMLKRKMELAKREQVSRFEKLAAPSGLLTELNPGIINHVRNRKQVHSIIEALVRSEKQENSNMGSKQAAHRMSGGIEINKRDLECVNDVGKHQPTFSHGGTFHSSSGSRQAQKGPVTVNDPSWILEGKVCDRDTYTAEKASLKNCVSNTSHVTEDDILALKLSSSMKASMSSTNLSSEESSNVTMVSSLSLKGS